MKYKLVVQRSRVILDQKGKVVVEFAPGSEHLAAEFIEWKNTCPLEKYKQACAYIKKYKETLGKQIEPTQNDFKGVKSETRFVDAKLKPVLFNSIEQFLKEQKIISGKDLLGFMPVSVLSKLSFSEFTKQIGVGATRVRQLKELCRAAGIQMLP